MCNKETKFLVDRLHSEAYRTWDVLSIKIICRNIQAKLVQSGLSPVRNPNLYLFWSLTLKT